MKIKLPYNFTPRPYQMSAWQALESGIKRVVSVWHRRAGKDLVFFNWMVRSAMERVGLYWHLFPTYEQGRKAVWIGKDRAGRAFMDYIPKQLVYRTIDDKMTAFLHGGSIIQVVGTDHIDRLMGANPVGVILSEYAMQNPLAWDYIRPMLAENGGWALFPYTPRGRNHGWRLYNKTLDDPNWFTERLTVDDTHAVPMEAIEEDRSSGMPEEMIQQEYWCSFDSSLVGAYYAEVLRWLTEHKRITSIQHSEDHLVYTGWDLGKRDATAIWFAQLVGHEFRLIDYYESSGQEPQHYVKVLRGQQEGYERMGRYIYGDAILPWDAEHASLGRPLTVADQFRNLGLKVRVGAKFDLEDQHAGVRKELRECWIEESNCERGIQSLREYIKQEIPDMRGPDGERLYRDTPVHNWASHGASAIATLLMNFMEESKVKFKQPSASYVV